MVRLPILMTASISTHGMRGACFTAEMREQMYMDTLKYYTKNLPSDQPIVFADNSGWDLGSFAKKTGMVRRVEFISVDFQICDQARGKGYNEILLINCAIEQSSVICAAGAFLKVTGRYPIYNLLRFLREAEDFLSQGGQFYGDMKDHKVFDFIFPHNTDKWNGHAAYTVFFATTVDFYQVNLAMSYHDCNDYTNAWIEVVWYRILRQYRCRKNRLVQLRFPVEPYCGGMQGTEAKTLVCSQSNISIRSQVARLVGNVIRIFLPWFWF